MAQQAMAFSPFVGAKLHADPLAHSTSDPAVAVPSPKPNDELDSRGATKVSPQEVAWLRAHGRRAADDLIRLDMSTGWQGVQRPSPDHADHPNATTTDDKAIVLTQTVENGFCSIRGTAAVYATADEVMQVLSVKHPRPVRDMYSHFFGMSPEGRAPVTSCVYCQPADDNAAVDRVLSVEGLQLRPHWSSAATAPTSAARDTCDYAFLRYSVVVPEANVLGVCIWEDVDLATTDLVRNGHFRKCGFLVQAPAKTSLVGVQVSFILSAALQATLDGRTALPASTYFQMQHMVSSALRGVHAAVVALRLLSNPLGKDTITDGPRCIRCAKPFTFYRYKHHCRHCGDVVCAHCSTFVTLDLTSPVATTSSDTGTTTATTPRAAKDSASSTTAAARFRVCGGCHDGRSVQSMRRAVQKRHQPSFGQNAPPPLSPPPTNDFSFAPLPSPYRFRIHRPSTARTDASRSVPHDTAKTTSQPHHVRSPFVSTTTSNDGNDSSNDPSPPSSMSPKISADQFDDFVDTNAVKTAASRRTPSRGTKPAGTSVRPTTPTEDEASSRPVRGAPSDVITESTPLSYGLTFKDGNAWPDPPMTPQESWRLQKTKDLDLLRPHPECQSYIKMACKTMQCHVGAITVIGGSKGHLIAKVGVAADSMPRHVMFESHVLMSAEPLVVLDCNNDLRFMTNPLVCHGDIGIRFYVGVPLVSLDGCIVGAISVVDTRPRTSVRQQDLHTLVLTARTLMQRFEDSAATAFHSGQCSNETKPTQRPPWHYSSQQSSDMELD